MTLGLPVLWRRYLSELSIERAVADRTRCPYETGWNSFVATARAMGRRLKIADDITYARLMEWHLALGGISRIIQPPRKSLVRQAVPTQQPEKVPGVN